MLVLNFRNSVNPKEFAYHPLLKEFQLSEFNRINVPLEKGSTFIYTNRFFESINIIGVVTLNMLINRQSK